MSDTLRAVLAAARDRLRAGAIDGADRDARLLVAAVLGLDAAGLVLRAGNAVPAADRDRLDACVSRRLAGEPVFRILGRRAFSAHDFALSPATLEPRADTERLVELCRAPIARALAAHGHCRFVDVGTGTGAIAVSLLALFPAAQAVATDIAPDALGTARRNAAAAGVADRFQAVVADHLDGLAGPFDLVVSNPPYIPTAAIETLAREVRDHDPRLALDGGPDGLRSYRAIAADAGRVLGPGGTVAVEIGEHQGADVRHVFAQAGFELEAGVADLAGIERALLFAPSCVGHRA